MADTSNLALPLIAAAQNQKHVTHNVALRALDAVVQLSVADRGLATPPGSPSEGDRYIVAATATGAWTGWEKSVAAYQDGAWVEYVPNEGWLAWIEDENKLLIFDGSSWADFTSSAFSSSLSDGTFTLLGINGATADTTNRLSINTPGVLFNRESDSINVTLNKEAAGNDASFTFKTNFSTRALFGLLGDDDFALKTSPNGSTFYTMLTLDKNGDSATFGMKDIVTCQSSNQAQMQFHVLEEEITGLSGATVDSTIEIPNGAIVFNVSERVTTAITGATSFSVGTASEPSKFGSGLGIGLGGTNVGVIGPTAFYADTAIRLTAAGSDFTAGAVRIAIHYYFPQTPQS